MNLDQLTDEVRRRLEQRMTRTRLLGELPRKELTRLYVRQPPYEEIVIGILPPGELLQMPTEEVCQALLCGMPVWLWPQPYGKGNRAILLRKALQEAEQRLIRFGAQPFPAEYGRKERERGCWNRDGKLLGH